MSEVAATGREQRGYLGFVELHAVDGAVDRAGDPVGDGRSAASADVALIVRARGLREAGRPVARTRQSRAVTYAEDVPVQRRVDPRPNPAARAAPGLAHRASGELAAPVRSGRKPLASRPSLV